MKKFLLSVFVILLLVSCGEYAKDRGKKLEFEELQSGTSADRQNALLYKRTKSIEVIKNQQDFDYIMDKVLGKEAISVDFSKYQVLAIFMGEQTSGGYSVKVEDIKKKKSQTTVFIKDSLKSHNCSVDSAMTYPYTLVKYLKPKSGGDELIFEENYLHVNTGNSCEKQGDSLKDVRFMVFDDLKSGTSKNKVFQVVKTQSKFNSLINSQSKPSVNFAENIVIYATLGEFLDARKNIEITRVLQKRDHVQVEIKSTFFGENCTSEGVSSPAVFATIPKVLSYKPIVFMESKKIKKCD